MSGSWRWRRSGRRTKPSTTGTSCASTASGPTRSPSRGRIPRCSSGARARTRFGASSSLRRLVPARARGRRHDPRADRRPARPGGSRRPRSADHLDLGLRREGGRAHDRALPGGGDRPLRGAVALRGARSRPAAPRPARRAAALIAPSPFWRLFGPDVGHCLWDRQDPRPVLAFFGIAARGLFDRPTVDAVLHRLWQRPGARLRTARPRASRPREPRPGGRAPRPRPRRRSCPGPAGSGRGRRATSRCRGSA